MLCVVLPLSISGAADIEMERSDRHINQKQMGSSGARDRDGTKLDRYDLRSKYLNENFLVILLRQS
jgi:hypothetical protein